MEGGRGGARVEPITKGTVLKERPLGETLQNQPVTWRDDMRQISVKNKTEQWVST